ncbi:hypothetical protein Nepgr_003098 [Nepenthes gracilis]|uniref:DUF1421 domain-containing protein n=1 Tax=Nepenthes gracilis TaxID=150966 RepID=A0AAD3XCX9_NEPGR|nr:hypothetical protein Nepgr_003098 [Nepenthes gracilis]
MPMAEPSQTRKQQDNISSTCWSSLGNWGSSVTQSFEIDEFMEKRIMDLTFNSQSIGNYFSDSDSPDDDHTPNMNEDYVIPSYDFHPIRHIGPSKSLSSGFRSSSSMDHQDSAEVFEDKICRSSRVLLISMIDDTIKKHSEDLLHAVYGVSARITQLESRTRQLENLMDDLKESIEFNFGRTDGDLRHLENILREVHAGVQFLRDKQEITEAQLLLTKLQLPQMNRISSQNQKADVETISAHQDATSVAQQLHGSFSVASSLPPAVPPLPSIASFFASHQIAPPPLQPPPPSGVIPWLPENQIPPVSQPGNLPPSQVLRPPPPMPHEPYQLSPHYPQGLKVPQMYELQPPFSAANAQFPPPPILQLAEIPSSIRPSSKTTGRAPTSEQFYSGYSQSIIGPPANSPDCYLYSQHHDHESACYRSSAIKPSHPSSPIFAPNCPSNQSRSPTAQVLPYALPTASTLELAAAGSGGNESKIPVDDVVNKITVMGFRQNVVRETVMKLMESGQPVDLNAVLDKLMSHEKINLV